MEDPFPPSTKGAATGRFNQQQATIDNNNTGTNNENDNGSNNNNNNNELGMGPQSQRRISMEKRTHNMQSANKGYQKKKTKTVGQLTIFGDIAFDATKHCVVCKARAAGRDSHKPHHPRCPGNRKTRGVTSKEMPQLPPVATPVAVKTTATVTTVQQGVQAVPVSEIQQQHHQTTQQIMPVFMMFWPPPTGYFAPPPSVVPQVCCKRYRRWLYSGNRRGRPPHDWNCTTKALPN